MIREWILRIFGGKRKSGHVTRGRGSLGRTKNGKKTPGTRTHTGSGKTAAHRKRPQSAGRTGQAAPFRGVRIHSLQQMCPAAQRTRGQVFLAAHAPQLPLGGCSDPDHCHCKYKHLTDRRQEVRRDTDVGLPRRPYHADDRRYRRDRRKAAHRSTPLTA